VRGLRGRGRWLAVSSKAGNRSIYGRYIAVLCWGDQSTRFHLNIGLFLELYFLILEFETSINVLTHKRQNSLTVSMASPSAAAFFSLALTFTAVDSTATATFDMASFLGGLGGEGYANRLGLAFEIIRIWELKEVQ
jgi:hypothetical protein